MPHDPLLVTETKSWFIKAANDLRAAVHEFSAEPPLLGDIVFHCQQAAEKAMKGFLTWHNCPFRKTHSLEEIGEQCLAFDQTLKLLVDRAVPPYRLRLEAPLPRGAGGTTSCRSPGGTGTRSRGLRSHPQPPACGGSTMTVSRKGHGLSSSGWHSMMRPR